MDIHSLRYFMVVAQTLNITRAAEQLFVSRQALSRAIHDLEKECGSDLFVHGSGRIALTATGRDLLEKTIPLVEQFDELQTGLDIQSKKKPARIRIAIGLGTMNTLSPAVFVDFRRNFPQIDLLLMEICDDEVRKVLDSNEADLGILNTIPGRIANYEHRLIQPGQFCLQVSTGNRLSHKTVLTPMDLHNQPLVTLGDRCDMHVVLMERCRAAGSTPQNHPRDHRLECGQSDGPQQYRHLTGI